MVIHGIQGVPEKYPTGVHISAFVLFLVIRTVASFEVVPIWLNHTVPAVLPHLKAVLERRFWKGLQLAPHYSESSRCRRTAFLWAPFSILGTSKSHRELWRDCSEAGEAVQSGVSPTIAAQGSMNRSPLDQKRGRFLLTASRNLFRTST